MSKSRKIGAGFAAFAPALFWALLLMSVYFLAMRAFWYLYVRVPATPKTPPPDRQQEGPHE
jgi:hypothetical protein